MGKRIKMTKKTPPTIEQAKLAMTKAALASNSIKNLEANREKALINVRETYESGISKLTDVLKENAAKVKHWADAHPEKFSDKKSMDWAHGKLGYRLGNHSVKAEGTTQSEALAKLQEKGLGDYVNNKPSINKEAIIKDRNNDDAMKKVNGVGLFVRQDESFFIEFKTENADG